MCRSVSLVLIMYPASNHSVSFIDGAVDTQRLPRLIPNNKNGTVVKTPRSKRYLNRGRTSVITPQSFVAFTVDPSSDKHLRCKGNDKDCLAPYCDDDDAYRGFEGEIAWIRNNDFTCRSGMTPNTMPPVRVFVTLGGIPISQADNMRPVGMMKNGCAGQGVEPNKDNSAGVVIGMGLVTLTNTGPDPILAGRMVWVSPFPFIKSDTGINGEPPLQGLNTPFVNKGKWYGATYTLTDTNVSAMALQLDVAFNHLFAVNRPFHKNSLKNITRDTIVTHVERTMTDDLHLRAEIPMWKYGYIKAACRLIDACEEGEVPDGVKRFAAWALNQCNKAITTTVNRYEKMIGAVTPGQPQEAENRFDTMGYQQFNCKIRRRLETAMTTQLGKAHEWIRRLVIGLAVTSADQGRTFDSIWGYGK